MNRLCPSALVLLFACCLDCRRRHDSLDGSIADVVAVKPPRLVPPLTTHEVRPPIPDLPTTDPFAPQTPNAHQFAAPLLIPIPPNNNTRTDAAAEEEPFDAELIDPSATNSSDDAGPLTIEAARFHCNMIAERSRCIEHTASSLERLRSVTDPVAIARAGCSGSFAAGACPTASLVGVCLLPDRKIVRFYSRGRTPFRRAAAETECSLTSDAEFSDP